MKITKEQLKQIIKEELENFNSVMPSSGEPLYTDEELQAVYDEFMQSSGDEEKTFNFLMAYSKVYPKGDQSATPEQRAEFDRAADQYSRMLNY